MPVTVYPIGTTIFNPDKCYNGYTLFCSPGSPVTLIDMNGNIVQEWKSIFGEYTRNISCRAKLLKNGNLLVIERKEGQRVAAPREYSWNGDLVWEYEPQRLPGSAHHDVERLDNGNTLILCSEDLPEEYRKKINDPVRRSARPFVADLVLEVRQDKEVVWEWHMYNHIDINRYCETCNPGDWTHTNTVRALPENKWYDSGDERFKPGNIILSPRNLSCIFIVDKDTKEVVWEYKGSYAGGLAGQHEPHMIEKGLPGEGNIIIFDNGAPPNLSWAHTGKSYILEINPTTKGIVWKYENGEKFHCFKQSNVQRLQNGNTFICETTGPRIFEVTPEGEIVWEYAIEWHRVIPRANRYPYDYCPQLRDLKKPEEKRVVPPSHVRTKLNIYYFSENAALIFHK